MSASGAAVRAADVPMARPEKTAGITSGRGSRLRGSKESSRRNEDKREVHRALASKGPTTPWAEGREGVRLTLSSGREEGKAVGDDAKAISYYLDAKGSAEEVLDVLLEGIGRWFSAG